MGKDDYIQTNVILFCDRGTMPMPFIATPKTQNHHSITGGTIRDNLPLLNILPFGVCTVTRYPCIPVMPLWQDYPKSPWFIEGFQPLLLSSCAKCMLGGTIRVLTSYMEVPAVMKDIPKTWTEKLLAGIDKGIGMALLSPFGPIMEAVGMGDVVQEAGSFGRGVVQGFAKGLASTVEGLYNMVAHPLDTLGGMATLAGTAIVGYAQPIPGITPEQRLEAFDKTFGTHLSDVNEGIKQSLAEAGETLAHGSNVERGEVVGQAIEFIAELAVGTKGAGAALKSVKGGSMGAKMAKGAGYVDKVLDITKAAGNTLKKWTLGKLPKAIKGIFGKKRIVPYDDLGKKPPCFLSNTLIDTTSGLKPIELVNETDMVVVFDFKTRIFVVKNVVNKFQNWAEIYYIINTESGDSIKATGRHMFWIENEQKWQISKKLNIGDCLKTKNGFTYITEVIRVDNVKVDTFNLEIQDCHNYLVGLSGILVHNQSKPSSFESTVTKDTKFYKITNNTTGEVYIGQTTRDIDTRFKEHGREKSWTKQNNYSVEPIIDPNRPKDLTPYESRVWERHYMKQEEINGKNLLNKEKSIISKNKYEQYEHLHSPCR